MKGRGPRLVLASASPRRRQLLAEAGFKFEIVTPSVEEVSSRNFTLCEATSWNALRKGIVVARLRPNDVVLAADTLVELDGRVIGKPADRAEAARTLRLLSGQTHIVASSVFVAHLRGGRSESFTVLSRVVFKKLTDLAIKEYLANLDPLDKAGAYAAQGTGGVVIARILGSRSNVIGLPMKESAAALERFGVRARRPRA
jgi:septum formation protein